MADQHEMTDGVLRLAYPYLAQHSPVAFPGDESGSYADPEHPTVANNVNEWSWGLGDIVNSLLHSGLELEWLHEHSEGYYPMN